MRVRDLAYDLPEERIAQAPPEERDGGRMLVVGDELVHDVVRGLARRLPPRALVIVNDTRVLPARLLGARAGTGGKVEIFLVRELAPGSDPGATSATWLAMTRASKPLKEGAAVELGPLRATVRGRAEDGLFVVELVALEGSVRDAVRRSGHVPLPPYIRRPDSAADRERYQTVFAEHEGAVAAPTAGLHLSRAVLADIEASCELARLTLHVGLGTFQPVTVEDLDDHPMHEEAYEIPQATAAAIARAREEGRAVVAIGTTVARALESAKTMGGGVQAGPGRTRLCIQPGHAFAVTDLLFTNFHLPGSTLLALACAFGGTERVLSAYRAAIDAEYMFFSYGDAMLLAKASA